MSINRRPLRYAHSEGHTDLCYTDDGKRMITCGSDGDIRIWAGIDDADPESFCVGEASFSVVQKSENIYVCRDDGRVMIFKYPEGERNGTLTRFTAPATHVTVGKKTGVIACISEDFSVKVYNSPEDTNNTTFTDLGGPALSVAISPNEHLLAVSCGDGTLYIWNLPEKKLLKSINCVPYTNSFISAGLLCRMCFDPKGKFLAYPEHKEVIILSADHFGKVYTLSAEIDSSLSIVQYSPCGKYIAASSSKGDVCIWQCQSKSTIAVSAHDKRFNVSALVWNPQGNGEISFCDMNGQIGTLEFLANTEITVAAEVEDDFNFMVEAEDDENVISLEQIKNDTLHIASPSHTAASSDVPSRAQSPERPRSPPCTLQPPFQPGSTPAHLSQRYLVYNDVGIVRLYNEEDDSSIDVQFHDAAFHKNIYMKNILSHTMGSLSTSVFALACEVPSKIVCLPLKVGSKEWSVDLPDLEEILCIAASSAYVAVATNVRMLRIFSIFGSQLTVLAIPGPAVSIAASKKFIFIVYHACTAHSKDQNLSGMLIQLNDGNITSKILPIAITPQSTLTWIGFSDTGSLASYDSAGILRVCKLDTVTWIPACDTTIHTKGASDTYFLTHVSESTQKLRVIHCRGAIYPATTPLPLLLELPMQLPLCEIDTDKVQLEDKLFRWSYFEVDQPQKLFKETAIKLFVLACTNNLEDRAYELLELLNSPQLITLAMKYATKINRSRLVERIHELLQKLEGETSDNEENNPNVSIKPVIKHTTKNKPEPPQSVVSQEVYTPELFTDTSFNDSASYKEDTMIQKTAMRNPFLKNAKSDQTRNPLSLTNSSDGIENSNVDNTKPVVTVKPASEEKPVNQNNAPKEVESFQSWFSKRKPDLEKEHPELAPSELVRHALKLFKKQSEKRKATDDGENTQKAKQSKLSAFSFSK